MTPRAVKLPPKGARALTRCKPSMRVFQRLSTAYGTHLISPLLMVAELAMLVK